LAAACIGIVGSLFFAIRVVRQRVETLGQLAGSYWDWNPHLPPALASQKSEYLCGGGLIVIAFVLQLASFFPSQAQVLSESQARVAPWLAAVATVLLFVVVHRASLLLSKRYEREILEWLKAKAATASART
jgi:hypothetical protein